MQFRKQPSLIMSADEVFRLVHEFDQWFLSSIQSCENQNGRELTVGDKVNTLRSEVDADGVRSNVVYRVEKIEYVGSTVSFVELSKDDPVDTQHVGAQQSNWVRVNVKECSIIPFIDINYLPVGVLKASVSVKASPLAGSSLLEKMLHSVMQNALFPAQEKLGEAADALQPLLAELFAINQSGAQEDDIAEAKSSEGEFNIYNRVDDTPERRFSSGSMSANTDLVASQFRSLFCALSRYSIVLSCYIDITLTKPAPAPTSGAAQQGAVVETSLVVQDMEIDATPMKQRTSSRAKSPGSVDQQLAHAADSPTIADLVGRLCVILEKCVIPLVAAHLVPLLVSVPVWAQNMCAVSAVVQSLIVLSDVIQRSNCVPTEQLCQFDERRRKLAETLSTQFDRTGNDLVQFYELSMIDNIVRQDWQSHSKYMRDKKFTHGIVALCATMRSAIWDMYYISGRSERESGGPLRAISSNVGGTYSPLSLQLLLSSTVEVCRTYMGFTELSLADCADLALTDNIVRMVQPSRVRSAQWRKDLCYTVYMVLDTLAWIITQDTMLGLNHNDSTALEGTITPPLDRMYSSAQKAYDTAAGSMAVTAQQKEALLLSPAYSDQAGIITELLYVLRYILLGVYIATEPDAQRVLDKLTHILAPRPSPSANIPSKKADNMWQSILEVAGSLSVFDTLTDLFTTEIATSEGNPTVHRTQLSVGAAPVHTAVVYLPTTAFSTAVDVVTHCGLHAFHINEQNGAEIALYAQEMQQHVAAVAKDGGALNKLTMEKAVMHQRIAGIAVSRPQSLLRMLTAAESVPFNDVFMEVNGVAEPDVANGRRFVVEMLKRRYEVNVAQYPALTETEATAAVNIQKYIDELATPS